MTPERNTVTTFIRFIIRLTGFQIAVCMRQFERPARVTSLMTARGNHVSTLWRQIALIAAIVCVFVAGQVQGNGTNPTVVEGQAGFSTQGSTLSITNSPGAIIHWQGFSIDANETTRFIQQSAASSVLNRVIGSDPSVILGTLTSNGRVFLINPSGILVGQGAHIDVAGLVASTLNLSNQDFLAGRLNFASNPLAGTVENQGSITTPSGGSVYLVGSNVTNSGIISSPQGDVILAAGQSAKIFDSSTPGVKVELTASDNAAVNLGEILAQSGEIGIYGAALRNAGIINADQVVRDASGKLVLRAKQSVTLEAGSRICANGELAGEVMVQSESGTTLVYGTIEAKGTGTGQTGGTVRVLGDKVDLLDHAHINVSGNAGGGTVLVGGNFHGTGPEQTAFAATISANSSINADAINSGNGGRIAIWSDGDTSVAGMLTAHGGTNSGDGGFIETSGHNLSIAESTRVNTLASQGKTGTWLIDPQDFTVAASGGDITGTALSSNIGTTDVEVQSSGGGTPGSGNVNINDAVAWSANNILTLTASNNVNINANITATGNTAGLVINPNTANGADSASGTGVFNLNGASITLSGTSPSLAIAGASYTVINDLGSAGSTTAADLQGMSGDRTANYALGSNINASETASWNAGMGFTPIGNLATPFTGIFDGLGHTVSMLTINLATPDVGLFGVTGSGTIIRNVGLVGSNITGLAGTGALVGNNGPDTSIINSYSSGSVSGAAGTGGLVGSSTTGSISNSYSTSSVTGDAGTGGLIGSNTSGAISKSYATGDVSGAAGAGGLVGSNTSGVISTSYATGSVSGAAGTGGLIGSNTSGAINNSYATGGVNGGTGAGVGGLIGSNTSGTIMNSYAAGGVSGTGASRGALIGSSNANVVSNSYWDKTTSIEQSSAGGGIGMTTAEMMAQANFTSATTANSPDNPAWDFVNTWTMYEGITYPLLSDFITPLTVTANNDVKTYDGQLYSGGNGVTYSALVNGIAPAGTLSYSGTSQGAINANSYVITPGGLQPDQHYLITFIDGTLTIDQKALTAVDLIGSVTKQYDGFNTVANLTTGNYSITGFIAGEGATIGVTSGTYDAGKNVQGPNSGVTSALLAGLDYTGTGATLLTNYDLSGVTGVSATGNIGAITAKALSLTPVSDSKQYDGLITSTAAVTVVGNVAGDTVTVAEEYASKNVLGLNGSTLGIKAGYTIVDGASADMSGNYTVTTNTAAGTIIALGITGSITAANKVYNGNDTATIATRTLTGAIVGDDVSYIGGSALFSDKNAGTGKTVTGTGLSLDGTNAGNYTVNDTATTLANITPAQLGIAANSTTRLYGEANPAFSATFTGFQNGETTAALTGTLEFATPAFPSSNVGNYSIIPSGQSSTNYTITYVNGLLGVTPVSLMVTADAKSKVYGTSDPTLTFSATGLVNNPALGVVDTADTVLSGALTRVPGESALGGPYAITQGTLAANSNYALGFTHNNLIIIGAAAEPVLGFNAGQIVFAGVINNEFYYRPGNFWHISLNPNNADPGFDVMRGTNDLNSRLRRSLNPCDSIFGGGFCETWSFPQQREKIDEK
ncbi:MAG: MBG domain-containing protein [Pseudomonadota bacterium]